MLDSVRVKQDHIPGFLSLCLSSSAWIMTQHWYYSGASFSGPSGITGSNLVVRNQKRETQFIGRSLTEASFARAFPPKRISRSIMNSFLNIPSLCWTKFSSADQTTMTIIVSIERLKRFKVVPIVATRNCTMKICLPTHTCQFRLKGFHEGEDRSCIPNVILSSFTIGNGELSLSTNLSSQLFQLLTSPRYLSSVGSSSEDNFSS
jgi:hypothetical protein